LTGVPTVPRLATKAVLRRDDVRQTHLLLLPERVVKLNTSSAAILDLCDGSRTVQQVIDHLQAEYGRDDLEGEVVSFLGEAAAHGWVVGAGAGDARSNGA